MVQHLTVPVNNNDHVQGPSSAPVTLLEYGDFECPDCAAVYPIVQRIQKRMGKNLRFVFRAFPLRQIHPYAELAAEAAEIAGSLGDYWGMFNLLFQNQEEWVNSNDPEHVFVSFASHLQLDVQKFTQELNEHTYYNKVQQDFESGIESGVQGTPTFFINGNMYTDSYEFESLFTTLQQFVHSYQAL